MAKKGIKNDQTYRGRFKGTTDTHVPNDNTRKGHERMTWKSPQFCEVCWNKPCRCGVAGDTDG